MRKGLAQLARPAGSRPSMSAAKTPTGCARLIGARERLIRLRKDLEGHIRGVLKTFGIRMTGDRSGRNGRRSEINSQQLAKPIRCWRTIADGFIAAHATLCQAAEDLKAVNASNCQGAARRAPLDDRFQASARSVRSASSPWSMMPNRFRRTTDVGAFLGLTPKRHQSGETDWSGRVSKCGDGAMRGLLFEAAGCLIRQVKRFSPLKSWAVRLAGRTGFKKAAVATARKIAV